METKHAGQTEPTMKCFDLYPILTKVVFEAHKQYLPCKTDNTAKTVLIPFMFLVVEANSNVLHRANMGTL